MRKEMEILLFAGTTEGRILSEVLSGAEIRHTICVATEYGETVLKQNPFAKVRRGRMNRRELERFLESGQFAAVVDATHPFAGEITGNIQAALKKTGRSIPYLRLKREQTAAKEGNITYFRTNEACAKALENIRGNILLTTGSKELSQYCVSEEIRNRLYVRILPAMESLSACMEQGICGKQILAMQGPFTEELNEAILRQYKISCLVTKESGAAGGYPEKIEAAKKTGTQVFVIGRPAETEGDSFLKVCHTLEEISGKKLPQYPMCAVQGKRMEITLAGIGMGHRDCMTKEVEQAVNGAEILLGARRLLEKTDTGAETHPFYQAEQIVPFLHRIQNQNELQVTKNIVILFSGDSGFYSGCQSVYTVLEKEIRKKRLNASLRVLPGISSVAYLASCTGESYHDAAVYSMHGKKLCNLARRLQCSPRTFLLTSGVRDVNWLGRLLVDAGMTECKIITGYQLSYQEQRITGNTPSECCELKEEGLYTCLVKNPYAVHRRLTHGMAENVFIRERIPMTKEEVREISICKLHLRDDAVVYDIGSGTGSAAVEIAGLSDEIQVYAVERKPDAVSLIEKNKARFGLENITVVSAEAPEGLADLPAATHALIGGSGGRLKEIVAALRQINPAMRVVVHAVSMETICEIRDILSDLTGTDSVKEEETVQVQISRTKKAGSHHLMQSENPVWICAFSFCTSCKNKENPSADDRNDSSQKEK